MARLRALLRYCPNVVSLALCRLGLRSFPSQPNLREQNTVPFHLLEIEGLYTQGSRPGRTVSESGGGISKWTALIGRTGFHTTSSIPDATLITLKLVMCSARLIQQSMSHPTGTSARPCEQLRPARRGALLGRDCHTIIISTSGWHLKWR